MPPHPETTTLINLAVIPFEEQYVFSVESNSTISALAFKTTNWTLSFAATGPNGTRGHSQVTVAKSLVTDTTNIRVYLDGNQTEYAITSVNDSWLLAFDYIHSIHQVMVDLEINIIPESQSPAMTLLFVIAILLAVLAYMKKHSM